MTKSKTPASKRCFMITPIGTAGSDTRKHADWVFRFVGNECDSRGIKLERADRMAGSPMITSRIFEALTTADFCVADLTNLNANVFYELGVRHSFRMPVVHIAQVGTVLPFDNAQHDTTFFDVTDSDSLDDMAAAVGRQLDAMIENGTGPASNPLTHALGSIEVSKSGDPKDQVLIQMGERLSALERLSRRVAVTPDNSTSWVRSALERAVDGHPASNERVANALRHMSEADLHDLTVNRGIFLSPDFADRRLEPNPRQGEAE